MAAPAAGSVPLGAAGCFLRPRASDPSARSCAGPTVEVPGGGWAYNLACCLLALLALLALF